MALIKCPECGKKISDKARKCPDCGCPIKKRTVKIFTIPVIVLVENTFLRFIYKQKRRMEIIKLVKKNQQILMKMSIIWSGHWRMMVASM